MPRDELNGKDVADGNTPLDADEVEGLIPSHVTTRAELNQWEATNIDRAQDWVATHRPKILNLTVLQKLHRRMFDETWEWAGEFRRSDKSISPYNWTEVPRLMRDLIENTQARHASSEQAPEMLDGLAVRFHHELVRIHPWPNGNGRHSRLATDALLRNWDRPPFSWGAGMPPAEPDKTRARYIAALRAADAGEYQALSIFVRS